MKYIFAITFFLICVNNINCKAECIDTLSLKDDYVESEYVFVCEVIEYNDSTLLDIFGRTLTFVTVEILDSYKGEIPNKISIINGGGLDFRFELGSTYIVFGDLMLGDYFIKVNQCSNTKLWSELKDSEKKQLEKMREMNCIKEK